MKHRRSWILGTLWATVGTAMVAAIVIGSPRLGLTRAEWITITVSLTAVLGVLLNAAMTTRSLLRVEKLRGDIESAARQKQWERETLLRTQQKASEEAAETDRRKREDETRHNLDRLRAYSRFLAAANAIVPREPKTGLLLLAQVTGEVIRARAWRAAEREFYLAYYEIRVIGDDHVVRAAERVWEAVNAFLEVHTDLDILRGRYGELLMHSHEASAEFVTAVRIELGIPDSIGMVEDDATTDATG